MAVMAEPTFATEKPAFDFEQKAAPVLPTADPISLDAKMDSNDAEQQVPRQNGDSEAQPHFLGLHPSLSNGNTPGPLAAPDALAEKDGASLEQPVLDVTEGIQPTAPFLAEATENALAGDISDPIATSVPIPIEQPTSDVRDEPVVLPSTADADVAAANADPVDGHADIDVANAAEDSMDVTSTEVVAETNEAAEMDTTTQPAEAASEPVPTAPANADGTQFEDAALADSAADVAPAAAPIIKQDTEMTDAPAPLAGSGVVRQRESDESDERSAKRAKVEEPPTQQDEGDFKKPELPALSTSTLAAPTNGLNDTPINVTPMSATPLPEGFQSMDATPMSPEQKKYLTELMRRAKKTKDALAYANPVDPVALQIPTYLEIIKEPMDLGTMEAKLKENKYESVDDLIRDLELMVNNSRTFNTAQHPVTLAGDNLRAYFMKSMKTQLPRKGAPPAPKPVKEKAPAAPRPALPRRESRAANARSPPGSARSPTTATTTATTETYALQPDGTPLIRRDSTANDGRPKREIHRPQPRDLPYQSARPKKKKHQVELKFCQHVMKELMSKTHAAYAYPFYDPVDPVALNIPAYHKIIKKPMDLGTVSSNLKNGLYSNWKEFKTDVDLVFTNCFKFNPETDGVHQMGKQLEEVFKGLWDQREDWVREHTTPEAHSEEEDEDEEDDEEEEEEAAGMDASRLSQIQEKIAALHAEMANLVAVSSQTSRKSPTAKSSKKSKKGGEATSKKTKRSGSNAAAASSKSSKSKKDKKVPKLTQEQKREVSEGIGLLDDAGMRKAVQIIRNGVPSLQNVNDDELELDIDEIPEAVVYDLYRFVRSLRTKTTQPEDNSAYDEPADDDYEPPSRARGSTAGGAGPGRKKNKPMTAAAQESKIAEIEKKLKAFEHQGGDVGAAASAARHLQAGSGSGSPDEDEDDDAEGSSSEEE